MPIRMAIACSYCARLTAMSVAWTRVVSSWVLAWATSASEAAPPAENPGLDQLFAASVKDAFFDFNKSDLRPDARQALTKTAEFLRSYPQLRIGVEGYCDERGSTEYNLGLGERRASAAKEFLVSLGIPADRLTTVSFGKEKQFCSEHVEQCWQQNRRAHFVRAQ